MNNLIIDTKVSKANDPVKSPKVGKKKSWKFTPKHSNNTPKWHNNTDKAEGVNVFSPQEEDHVPPPDNIATMPQNTPTNSNNLELSSSSQASTPTSVTPTNIMHQTDGLGRSIQKAEMHTSPQSPSASPPKQQKQGFLSGLGKMLSVLPFSKSSSSDKNGDGKNGRDNNDELATSRYGNGSKVRKPPPKNFRKKGLLSAAKKQFVNKKCLVLDLDETLVHSSFQPVPNADFIIPIEIQGAIHDVYVLKRPGVDDFMKRMGEMYEVVIFTASLSLYANPLLDKLDIHKVIQGRLYREHCTFYQENYVKDMNRIGRDITQSIIIDNSSLSYLFQPENAIGCSSYIDDPKDVELDQIDAFLTHIKDVRDVREHLHLWKKFDKNKPYSLENESAPGY